MLLGRSKRWKLKNNSGAQWRLNSIVLDNKVIYQHHNFQQKSMKIQIHYLKSLLTYIKVSEWLLFIFLIVLHCHFLEMVLFVGFITRSWSLQLYTCTVTSVILLDARELTLHLLVQTIKGNKVRSQYCPTFYTPSFILLL